MFESLLSLLLIYSYLLIFIVGFLASLGLPIPATALFIAAGAFVGSGYLEGYMLFFAGWWACILGDITGYALALHYGRSFWKRFSLDWFLPISLIERKYGSHMETRGFLLIFTSRFLFTAIGPSVNILAGFMKTGWKVFLSADVLGEFLYITITVGLGYSFASEWQTIVSLFESASSFLSSTLLFLFIVYIIYKNRSRFFERT